MHDDTTTVDETTLEFDALFNVRDLGGCPVSGGGHVRSGRLYRADGVHRAAGADLERLAALGLRTVIDLRTLAELELGRFAASDDVAWHHAPLLEQIWSAEHVESIVGDDDAIRFLVDRYVDMTVEAHGALAAAISVLADPDSHPALFHCAAGKDRTGVLAAMVLALLGVERQVIIDDYARSGAGMQRAIAYFTEHEPRIADIMSRQPDAFMAAPHDAMGGFLAEIEQRHGSVEAYVRGIGVTDDAIASLRDTLVTD